MSTSSADSGDHLPEPRPNPSENDADGLDVGNSFADVQPDGQGGDDPAIWREVFEQSETGLRRFLAGKLPQSADVEDCIQSVLVAMLRNKTKIPPAVRRAWLYRVAANEAARWWRQKSSTDRVLEKHAETAYTVETAGPARIETEETLERIERAIDNLGENPRRIVNMRLRDTMTFQQIADELDLPLGTVLTRMRRAMQKLRSELDDGSEND